MTLPQRVYKYALSLLFVGFLFTAGLSLRAAAATQLARNPTSLRFGEVVIGHTATLPLILTNKGTSGFRISTLTTSSGYSATHPALPLTLSPGQSLSVNVTFKPTVSGADAG